MAYDFCDTMITLDTL